MIYLWKGMQDLSENDTWSRLETSSVKGLLASSCCSSRKTICLPKTYSKSYIPLERAEIPTQENISEWDYLHPIIESFPSSKENIPVGILIGGNCLKAMEPTAVIPSDGTGPYAINTNDRVVYYWLSII